MQQGARPVELQQLLRRSRRPCRSTTQQFPAGRRTHVTMRNRSPTRPAGFVGTTGRAADVRQVVQAGSQTLVVRAMWALVPRAIAHLEQRPQQLHALAMRDSPVVVHDRQQWHGRSVPLAGYPRRRGLQRMTALYGLAAVIARAMHVEPTDHGAGKFLSDIAARHAFRPRAAAAMRTLKPRGTGRFRQSAAECCDVAGLRAADPDLRPGVFGSGCSPVLLRNAAPLGVCHAAARSSSIRAASLADWITSERIDGFQPATRCCKRSQFGHPDGDLRIHKRGD